MTYCWFTYEEYDPALKLFMGMNFFVHGIMYTYYALRVMVEKFAKLSNMLDGNALN